MVKRCWGRRIARAPCAQSRPSGVGAAPRPERIDEEPGWEVRAHSAPALGPSRDRRPPSGGPWNSTCISGGTRRRWSRSPSQPAGPGTSSTALIETTIARDVLLMTRVDKPALLRRLFQLGCTYSGRRSPSRDAGTTPGGRQYAPPGPLPRVTSGAGMWRPAKFSPERVRQRASSPKLQVLNTAGQCPGPAPVRRGASTPEVWGRLVQWAVGAHLLNSSMGHHYRGVLLVRAWAGGGILSVRRENAWSRSRSSGASKGSLPGTTEAFTRALLPSHPPRRRGRPFAGAVLPDPRDGVGRGLISSSSRTAPAPPLIAPSSRRPPPAIGP